MAVRARPSSDVPAQTAEKLAEKVGVNLSAKGGDEEATQARQSGAGALLGYAAGLGIGTAYGLLRPLMNGVSPAIAGVGLGLAAMAASDVPATKLGVTDPSTWGTSGWIADIVPHLVYGVLTAVAYESFRDA